MHTEENLGEGQCALQIPYSTFVVLAISVQTQWPRRANQFTNGCDFQLCVRHSPDSTLLHSPHSAQFCNVFGGGGVGRAFTPQMAANCQGWAKVKVGAGYSIWVSHLGSWNFIAWAIICCILGALEGSLMGSGDGI